MSGGKFPVDRGDMVREVQPAVPEHQAADLMEMVAMLSPRDVVALAAIVRRTAEISETEGEEVAIAVLDQIQAILSGRKLDA
jgi:hypothetical protein